MLRVACTAEFIYGKEPRNKDTLVMFSTVHLKRLHELVTRPATTGRSTMARPTGLADSGALHWMLRIACAAEFVWHGAFGIITKAAWVPYFGVVGIPPEVAWKLMPMIGTVDITLGLYVGLVRPARAVLLYMAFWGLLTGILGTIVESARLLRIVGGAEIALGVIALVFPVPALLLLLAAWRSSPNCCAPQRANRSGNSSNARQICWRRGRRPQAAQAGGLPDPACTPGAIDPLRLFR